MDSSLVQCKICDQFYIKKTLHNCPPKRQRNPEIYQTCQSCGKENINIRHHLCEGPVEQYIDDALEGDALINLFIVRYLREVGIPRSRILHQTRSNQVILELGLEIVQLPPNILPLSIHNKATFIEALYKREENFQQALNHKLREYILNQI